MQGTYKRLLLMGKGGPWTIQELPIPTPGVGQFLVKILRTSICNQTDLNIVNCKHPPHMMQSHAMVPHHLRLWDKDWDLENDPLAKYYNKAPYPQEPYPTTLGHESVGIIVEAGPEPPGIDYGLMSPNAPVPFKVGDRVVVFTEAGLGQYDVVTRDCLFHLPDCFTDEEGSLTEPCMVSWCNPRALIRNSDRVCILGQGGIGLMATQWARIMGAQTIITSEPMAHKRELSKKFGADITVDPYKENLTEVVDEVTKGKGCDVVLEMAGMPETIQQAPYITRLHGRIGQTGACCVPVYCDWGYIHFKGIRINPASYNTVDDNEARFNNFMRSFEDEKRNGHLNLTDMISHRIGMTIPEIENIFDLIAKNEVVKCSIDPWKI